MVDNKFDLQDILVKATKQSDIVSRSEIKVTYENGYLPLISAPMDTVVRNKKDADLLQKNKIIPTVPRRSDNAYLQYFKEDIYKYLFGLTPLEYSKGTKTFFSLSLFQFEILLKNKDVKWIVDKYFNKNYPLFILVDIANGHMKKLRDLVEQCHFEYGESIQLMVGNVANPETYEVLSDAGADYVRLSVGTGSACLTSVQTAVGYPMGSLIKETYDLSMEMKYPAKIVADGGFKNYSDIIKALCLGADYVMMGSILNKSVDLSGDFYWKGIKVNKFHKYLFNRNFDIKKKYRGMSTKEVQRDLGSKKLRTSEGVVKYNNVSYYLHDWVENFRDYLSSAMSYAGAKNLEEFKSADFVKITTNSHKRFDK